MVFDKLLAKVINTDIKSNLSVNQHGGREHMSTMTAKIQMIYNMAKNGYDKILLIDLRKAFDLVDHLSLKDSINTKVVDKINKKILLNVLSIYEKITIRVENHKIHPTRGVPQGSVFGPTMFLLDIDDILQLMSTDQNTHTQAFVDDIIIAGKKVEDIQKAYNIISQTIRSKHMEINVDKCEFLTENPEEIILDKQTNQAINNQSHAKYLGQIINSKGQTNDIILRRNYNSIAQLVHTSQTFITLKSRIKLFRIYIRSKYNHLLPIIAINGNLETTWSEIRKVIFNDILKRSTQPKESAALIGCSYYSIIIKPLLKIIEQTEEDQNLHQFLIESTKKAFLHWTSVEQNHDRQITDNIKKFIERKNNMTTN
ncbi:MAG: hypothetical protein IJ853_02775 [Rickettsiales bacterium]|nr:hypothetical protein [Rickettsiales bacterium]